MKNIALVLLLAGLLPAASLAGVEPYNQDFEALDQADPYALGTEGGDGWWVYGNVWDDEGTYQYGYGPFSAPNDGWAFCQIVLNEGGPEQGLQQLVVFSDYNNEFHASEGWLIESNVYREWEIAGSDAGDTWIFSFNAKLGNIEGGSTAAAFIKILDPGAGYALTTFRTLDMTNIAELWRYYFMFVEIDQSMVGQLLQIGFMNTAGSYEGSGIFYDNIDFSIYEGVDVPVGAPVVAAQLRQNYPNPFNPATKIDFVLEQNQFVKLNVFDLMGRLVTTLHQGVLAEGPHSVTWDGTTAAGLPASAGQYRYVLTTPAGQVSRSMILLK